MSSQFFELPGSETAKFVCNDVHKPVRYGTSFKDGVDKINSGGFSSSIMLIPWISGSILGQTIHQITGTYIYSSYHDKSLLGMFDLLDQQASARSISAELIKISSELRAESGLSQLRASPTRGAKSTWRATTVTKSS